MATMERFQFVALLTKHTGKIPPVMVPFIEDLLAMLSDQGLNLDSLLNTGLKPSDNFDFQEIEYTTNAAPDTEDTVPHTLRRVPTGILVINKDKFADWRRGSTAWTDTNIYLKWSVASVDATIHVF